MRTSELNKGQPILALLAPSGANAATLGQPPQCAFDDPPSRRIFLVLRDRFGQGFAAAAAMGDMLVIVGLFNQEMDVFEIIAFVQTEMLFTAWSPYHDRNEQVINRPFVVLIGTGEVHRQGCASFINQDVNLGATLAPVGGIASCRLAAQRCGHRFAVDSLPLPANAALAMIEANHRLQDLVPNALLLPGLETFMQDAAGNAEPIAMDRFPLTACPQDVPEPIEHRPIICSWPAWPALLTWFGQVLLDAPPERAWNTEVVDILGLLLILVFQDVPRWIVFGQTNFPRGASFV